MAIFPRPRPSFQRHSTERAQRPSISLTSVGPENKHTATETVATDDTRPPSPEDTPDEDLQRGVQDAEAVALSWSKWALIAVFFNMWMLYFVNAFQEAILSNLLPYVTSDFETHSLLNVIYVVADAMSAAVYIPTAKILDVWGRAEGFLLMTVFATLGLILMAVCTNLTTFCAAYVFYTIGFGGMEYCVDVITADVSTLRNRGLAYAFTSSPYMITAFAGSAASEAFYVKISWRWGFGAFAIIFPAVAAPLYFILKYNLRKARQHGIVEREGSGRTFLQNVRYYIVEFDLFGVLVFSAGLTLFFLPFDIQSVAPTGWSTPYIIAMLVVGFVLLVGFAIYEWRLAPAPMFNFTFLSDRTVIGACLLDFLYQLSYYCWANYFTSFLQVVNDLSIAEAGYVDNTFDVVSGVLLLLSGWAIRKTGYFKWQLWIAVPLYIFSQGLMIYFRRPNQNVGYLVMCQVLISLGGSIFIVIEQLAILAAVDHQHVAATLALLNVVGTIGDGIGATVSGAIWDTTFYKGLQDDLPASALSKIEDIYESLDTQLSYPVGSAARLAIQKAYGYAQTRMLAAGTGIMALGFISLLLIRNINVKAFDQVKGMVF